MNAIAQEVVLRFGISDHNAEQIVKVVAEGIEDGAIPVSDVWDSIDFDNLNNSKPSVETEKVLRFVAREFGYTFH